MDFYYLNDVLISNPPANIQLFLEKYVLNKSEYKNRIQPKNSSYRIDDDKVTLLYNDITFEFPTNQQSYLISYFNARYNDLYSCCFNTQRLNVLLPKNMGFNLPPGEWPDNISQSILDILPYEKYRVFNPNIVCEGITENECLFFQRWYCRGLRDLVGYWNMEIYDSNCNCYIFDPKNIAQIKLGNSVNCFDKRCPKTFNDPALVTSSNCQTSVCANLVIIKDILEGSGVNIDKITQNLVCN